jgi:hypothetical protein
MGAQALEDTHLNLLRPERDEPVEPGGEAGQGLTRQTDDEVRVDVHRGLGPEKMKIIREPLVVLPAADERPDFGIEGLDTDLELERAGRKAGDDRAQLGGQAIGHQLEVIEPARLMPLKKEFQDRPAGGEVEVERAVHELELFQSAIQQLLHRRQERLQRCLAHGDVERREAEFAAERAPARGFHIHDAVREIGVRIEIVGQGQLRELRRRSGNHLGQRLG